MLVFSTILMKFIALSYHFPLLNARRTLVLEQVCQYLYFINRDLMFNRDFFLGIYIRYRYPTRYRSNMSCFTMTLCNPRFLSLFKKGKSKE